MPIYNSKCEVCGKVAEYTSAINDRHSPPNCSECGGETRKVVTFAGTVWAPTAGGFR